MLRRIGRRWVFIPDIAGGSSRQRHGPPSLDEIVGGMTFRLNSPLGGTGNSQGNNQNQSSNQGQNNNQGQSSGSGLSTEELASLRTLISAQGGDQNTLHSLFSENARLKTQLAQAEANQIPANCLILVGQDVETWKQLRGLNVPLADLKTNLETIGELQNKVARMEKESTLRQVAAITGWNPDVFVSLDGLDAVDRTYEVRDAEGGGKMVFVKEGEEQPVDAATYLQGKWANFIPSLLSSAATADDEEQTTLQTGGTVIVQQPEQNKPQPVGAPQNHNAQQGTQQLQGTVYLTQPAGNNTPASSGKDDEDSIKNTAKATLASIYGTKKKEAA